MTSGNDNTHVRTQLKWFLGILGAAGLICVGAIQLWWSFIIPLYSVARDNGHLSMIGSGIAIVATLALVMVLAMFRKKLWHRTRSLFAR